MRFSGEKLQELRNIRAGRFGYDELVARAEALSEQLVSKRDSSALPETSDLNQINALLLDITRKWEKDHEG